MARQAHQLAGRVSAAEVPNMVTFCTCGLGFFGESVQQADDRLQGHVQKVSAYRQRLGELAARYPVLDDPMPIGPGAGYLLGLLLQREQER
jgi:hypothetical protein